MKLCKCWELSRKMLLVCSVWTLVNKSHSCGRMASEMIMSLVFSGIDDSTAWTREWDFNFEM